MRLRDFSSPSARYWGRSACARVVAKVPGTSSVHRAGTPRATKTERGGTRQTVVHAGMTLRRATPTTERMLLSAPRPHCQDVLWSSETPRQGTFTQDFLLGVARFTHKLRERCPTTDATIIKLNRFIPFYCMNLFNLGSYRKMENLTAIFRCHRVVICKSILQPWWLHRPGRCCHALKTSGIGKLPREGAWKVAGFPSAKPRLNEKAEGGGGGKAASLIAQTSQRGSLWRFSRRGSLARAKPLCCVLRNNKDDGE